MRRIVRAALILLVLLVLVVVAGGVYLRVQLTASLPQLDGSHALPGLTAPVTVARDAHGVPTLTAATRADAARSLGFVHAQDRFFQMDLQRRQPAGELSALVGEAAFTADARMRVHRFRRVAEEAYGRTDSEWRGLLDAYADGVNAGLAALDAPPFEYLLLGITPEPWKPEDAILTVLAMFDSLQGRQAGFEQTNRQLRDALPEPMFRFLTTAGSEWDTPVAGVAAPRPPVPGPEVIDLRARSAFLRTAQMHARAEPRCEVLWPFANGASSCATADEAAIIGSNNWAVDAARSTGGALVANDMHLGIGVPNIWYRASMVYPDSADPLHPLRITGVTLPGLPILVVGSTGFVAWGFTNTGGDWSDLVRVEPDAHHAGHYVTPDGPKPFEVFDEPIHIKGAPTRTVGVRATIWGPIVWTDAEGREYAQHWVAHDATVLSSDLSKPERARTVDELLVAAASLGIPHQNLTMADHTGRIAWSVGGFIPRRRGLDGFTAESWADGARGWDGYLDWSEAPRIVDPAEGRIWTANAPVVGGDGLAAIGDGGYADGIRARIIRDRLMDLERAAPADMLDVQLDNRALFLERWRALALTVLDRPAAATPADARAARAEFRRLVETTWTGRASPDSVAYRLVRTFRSEVIRTVMSFVTTPALAKDPSFDYSRSARGEGPVWQLVSERPMHLLDSRFATWDDLLLSTVDTATADLTRDGRALDERTWGEFNRAQIVHPLATAAPLLPRWLNMPADPLPGDVFTPRAHSPRAGPSERMVVSPSREDEGILHMPTGQSAHPLSPHFGDMHRAWSDGTPVPFLPGPAVHTLTLAP